MTDCAAPPTAAAPPNRTAAPRTERCLDPEEFLRAELDRTYKLLAQAVRYGAQHTGVSERTLLEVFAETIGARLEEPAWIRARQERRLRFLLLRLERGERVAA